jgi:hypothetical protein
MVGKGVVGYRDGPFNLVCSVCLVYLVEPDRPRTSAVWRRRAGSNRCIAVLQTAPLTTWVRRPKHAL